MNRLFHVIIEWPRITVALILLIVIPFGYAYLHKSFLNNVKQFFEKDDPLIVAYEAFQETFGNEEIAIIVVHSEDLFTNKMLGIIRQVSEMAKHSEGIQRVFSLTEATEPIGREDTVSFESLVPEGILDASRLQALKEHVLHRELTTETLISKDGQSTVVVLELQSIASTEKKGEVLNRIESRTRQIVGDAATLYFSGPPYVEHEINALTQRDDKIFTPILVTLLFGMAVLSIKRISLSILSMVNLLCTMVVMVGAFVLAGNQMNMLTVVLAPMILTVSMADTIHIMIHFNSLYNTATGKSLKQALFETVRDLWFPCLFTSVVNAVGLLSFVTTSIGPLRTLGIYGAFGAMLEFLMAIILLPALVMIFIKKPSTPAPDRPMGGRSPAGWVDIDRVLQGIRRITIRHPWAVVNIFILAIAVSAVGADRIKYETNFANHLKESNPVRQGVRFIEENLFGTVPVALVVRAKTEDQDFTHPESLMRIDSIQTSLKKRFEGQFSSFFSVADYFKEVHRAFNKGQDDSYRIPAERSDVLDYYELGEAGLLKRVVSADKMEARISFNVYLGPIKHDRELENYLDTLFQGQGDRFSYQVTGASMLFVAMDQNLKQCLLSSFTSAFLVIFFLIHLVCKHWKLTLITIAPNLFPILATFGIMGFMDIPLDVVTVMIASITMSIAVDDTVHFMVWFRRFSLEGMDTKDALLNTYKHVGKEMLATAFILCIAFLALLTGSVLPVRAFGALTALALLAGVIAELFLLPALILIIKPKLLKKRQEVMVTNAT